MNDEVPPDLEGKVEYTIVKGFLWWARAETQTHCFHVNPRYTRAPEGVFVRSCCHCGLSERTERVSSQHGPYAIPRVEDLDSWSPWKRFVPYDSGY